jgi:hypothetical protein
MNGNTRMRSAEEEAEFHTLDKEFGTLEVWERTNSEDGSIKIFEGSQDDCLVKMLEGGCRKIVRKGMFGIPIPTDPSTKEVRHLQLMAMQPYKP